MATVKKLTTKEATEANTEKEVKAASAAAENEVIAAPTKAKTEVKTAPTKVEKETKATAKETNTTKTAAKTPAKKAPAKKPVAKTEVKVSMNIQFGGKSYTMDDLVKIAKDVWKYDLKQKVVDFKTVELYVKPEDGMVYYVINSKEAGSFYI